MTERELRILRNVADELRAIRQEIRALHDDQQCQDDTNNNELVHPVQVEITATPNLDPARSEYYLSENLDRNSFWRKIKPGVEAGAVFVAVILAVLTFCTFQQIKRQADIMHVAERPWIGVRSITVEGLSYSETTKAPQIWFFAELENVGRTPADVEIWAIISTKDWRQEYEQVCRDGRTHYNEQISRKEIFTVIPHFPWPYRIFPQTSDLVFGQRVTPTLIGCIIYTVDKTLKQTPFVADLSMKKDAEGGKPRLPVPILFDGSTAIEDVFVFNPITVGPIN